MLEITKQLNDMSQEDTYQLWLSAFKHMISRKVMTQVALVSKIKEIAPDDACEKGHINAVYKERPRRDRKTGNMVPTRASSELQEAISRAFGYSHIEFLELGRRIKEGLPLTPKKEDDDIKEDLDKELSEKILIGPTHFVDPDHVVAAAHNLTAAVQSLAVQSRRDLDRKHWWKELFDMLPTPALVIKDDIVIHQNRESIILGVSTGHKLCDKCVVDNCDKDSCALTMAKETENSATSTCEINGKKVGITARPFRHNGHHYILLIAHSCTAFE